MTDKYFVTNYTCKHCGNGNMSPNVEKGCIRGWKCNYCNHVSHPVREEIIRANNNVKFASA